MMHNSLLYIKTMKYNLRHISFICVPSLTKMCPMRFCWYNFRKQDGRVWRHLLGRFPKLRPCDPVGSGSDGSAIFEMIPRSNPRAIYWFSLVYGQINANFTEFYIIMGQTILYRVFCRMLEEFISPFWPINMTPRVMSRWGPTRDVIIYWCDLVRIKIFIATFRRCT